MAVATRTNKVRQFVRRLDESIGRPGDPLGTPGVRHHHLSAVVDSCGWKKRSRQRMDLITAELEAHGIFAEPALNDPHLPSDAQIAFSRVPSRHKGVLFPTEAHLQAFLMHNAHLLGSPFGGLAPMTANAVRREFPLPNGKKVDILFQNQAEKEYVAVELKVDEPGFGAWGQLLSYVQEIRHHAKPGWHVRGVLVTGSAPQTIVDAFEAANPPDLMWLSYDVQVHFPLVSGAAADDETSAIALTNKVGLS